MNTFYTINGVLLNNSVGIANVNRNALFAYNGKAIEIIDSTGRFDACVHSMTIADIITHAYSRTLRFRNDFEKDAAIVYQTLDNSFNKESKNEANEHLIHI